MTEPGQAQTDAQAQAQEQEKAQRDVAAATAAELKRRKVRKGTHSCWECRRRKIRCQFGPGNNAICLPCQARGTTCRSQEYVDKESRPSHQHPDRRMAQRLNRLEELMTRLVDRILPEAGAQLATNPPSSSHQHSPTPSQDSTQDDGPTYQQSLDVLEVSIPNDTPAGMLLGLRDITRNPNRPASMPTPESDKSTVPLQSTVPSRYAKASRALHALFPPQDGIIAIANSNVGPYYIISMFGCFRDVIEGKMESPDSVTVIPPITSHPTVLSKRLLQLCVCMQQLSPGYNTYPLQIKGTIPDYMDTVISAVTGLVTSVDDVVATGEGLESLVLLGLWHANAGNLRKSWLTYRRAMSLGQLMGIDRDSSRALKFVDPNTEPRQRPTPAGLWYRINASDRVTSLLLGLPAGDLDNSFATEVAMKRNTDMERLERKHTVITGRIIERNASKSSSQAYAMTQAIDCEMENAATAMGSDWWNPPDISALGHPDDTGYKLGQMFHLLLQIHHFDLLIVLHLPYMLRDPSEIRYDYSKATCARASREVLKRFILFRTEVTSVWACRHVDFSGLVAAMTLLLSYLRQHQTATEPPPSCKEREEDRRLVEVVRERMQHVAVINRDKVTQESADILGQMMPILDLIDASLVGDLDNHMLRCLHIKIPYLGTINFHPNVSMPAPAETEANVYPYGRHNVPSQQPSTSATPFADASSGISQLSPAIGGIAPPSASMTPNTLPAAVNMPMDMASYDASVLPPETSVNGMYMRFDDQPQDGVLEIPDPMAGAEDWVLQGVDTTYWSLLNGHMALEP